MRKELEEIKLIEQYLGKELSPAMNNDFDKRLASDQEFKVSVEIQRTLMEGIERIGLKEEIKSAKRRYYNGKNGFYLGGIILSTLLCFGIYHFYGTGNNQELEPIKAKESLLLDRQDSVSYFEEKTDETINEKEDEKNEDESTIEQDVRPVTKAVNHDPPIKFELPKKQYQLFQIDPSKDTLIRGMEGTLIELKANSIDTDSDMPVTLRLKEYYKMSDIAFSDLTTYTREFDMLETGGMIYIDVINEDEEELDLKNGKEMSIKFPYEKRKEGMALYQGELDEQKQILWELAFNNNTIKSNYNAPEVVMPIEEFDPHVFTLVEEMPIFPSCEDIRGRRKKSECSGKSIQEFVDKNVKYPQEVKNHRRLRKVYVRFIVDEAGYVSESKVIGKTNPVLSEEAIRVVNSLPRFIPGMQRGNTVKVQYTVPVNFIHEPSTRVYSLEERKKLSDSLVVLREIERGTRKRVFEQEVYDLNNENSGKLRKKEKEALINSINYYSFEESEFGWINCDRFLAEDQRRINFTIDEPISADTRIRLIFHDIKSILISSNASKGTRHTFKKVPIGEKVSIFSTKIKDNKPYICLFTTTISKGPIQLEYKPLKSGDIERYAQKINEIAE